jgi:hypothetical protein
MDLFEHANALQPRGDIDAVAHQIAVRLLHDVAEVNADAELDAAVGRQSGVALDQAVLHYMREADSGSRRQADLADRNGMFAGGQEGDVVCTDFRATPVFMRRPNSGPIGNSTHHSEDVYRREVRVARQTIPQVDR